MERLPARRRQRRIRAWKDCRTEAMRVALPAMRGEEPRTRTPPRTIKIAAAVAAETAGRGASEDMAGTAPESWAVLAELRSRFRRARWRWAAARERARRTMVRTGLLLRTRATTIVARAAREFTAAAARAAASSLFTLAR